MTAMTGLTAVGLQLVPADVGLNGVGVNLLGTGLSAGPGVALQGAQSPYDPAANALFAAMTVQPDAARKTIINNLIVSLKASGAWALLDVLYLTAAADAQSARLNWKAPGALTLSPQNSPAFAADRGYTGDGSSSYVLTGYNPTGNGINFVLDSASVWFWSRTAAAGTASESDAGAPSGTLLTARSSANQIRGRINDGTTSSMASTDGSGLIGISRVSSATKRLWQNGVQVGADIAVTSTTLTNAGQAMCGNGSTSFSIRQQSMAAWAASLTGKETAFYSSILTYMQAVGAA